MARTVISLFATLLVILPAALGAQTLQKGPYLQQAERNSVIVAWESQDFMSGTVRYGQTAAFGLESAATPEAQRGEVRLDNLREGTTYYYAVFQGDEQVSETYEFKTQTGRYEPFRFVLMGDTRSDHSAHAAVVEAVRAEPDIAFVINSGDLVSSGEYEDQWDTFFEIEKELMATTVVYPAIGNHDQEDGDVSIYDRLWVLPTEDSSTEHYYAFRYGNSEFIVLDGHVEIEPWYQCLLQLKVYDGCFTRQQDIFIQERLDAASSDSNIRHIFVVTHMAPYSSKEGRTGSAQMRAWLARFWAAGVDAVMAGHDHYYEHGISGNGIDYVISGGGGAPLYDVQPGLISQLYAHTPLVSESIHHYVLVEVDGEDVHMTTKMPDGTIVEEFDVGVRTSCETVADCVTLTPGACTGAWVCGEDDTCQWLCAPAPSCETVADCPAEPAGACPGHWVCELDQCAWLCDGGECEVDADCADKEPLNDCWGGHWECPDEVCEWVCPPVPDDVVQPPEDVPVVTEDVPQVQEDVPPAVEDVPEPKVDVPPAVEDVPEPEEDVSVPAEDVQDTPQPPSGSASSSGGCAAGGASSSALPISLLLVLLSALVVWRRSGGSIRRP